MQISGLDQHERRVLCGYLNRLAIACRDDIIARSSTARARLSEEEADELVAQVTKRLDFIDELRDLVARLGGRLVNRGSHFSRAHRALHELTVFVTGRHLGDEYERCARAETRAADAYDDVLGHALPALVRIVLERQKDEIVRDRALLRKLRYLH